MGAAAYTAMGTSLSTEVAAAIAAGVVIWGALQVPKIGMHVYKMFLKG